MSDSRIDNIEKAIEKIKGKLGGIFIGSLITSSVATMYGVQIISDRYSGEPNSSLEASKIIIQQNKEMLEVLKNIDCASYQKEAQEMVKTHQKNTITNSQSAQLNIK